MLFGVDLTQIPHWSGYLNVLLIKVYIWNTTKFLGLVHSSIFSKRPWVHSWHEIQTGLK